VRCPVLLVCFWRAKSKPDKDAGSVHIHRYGRD
jgi:hypothetical protein